MYAVFFSFFIMRAMGLQQDKLIENNENKFYNIWIIAYECKPVISI